MRLSRYEKETIILLNAAEDTASIYTADPVWKRKLDKLVEKNPQCYQCVKADEVSKTYSMPKRFISLADPTNTMPKVIFPPSRMRENSQRPKSSVPNGYSALLDRYLPRIFVAVGSWGAKNDPNKKNSNITIGIEYERICFVRLIVWPPLSQTHPVAKSAVIYPKGY